MESIEGKMRLLLVLGKFQVSKVEYGNMGTKFTINLTHGVTIIADTAVKCDVRVGDLLTLYTEVYADAQPSQPPEQRVH